MLKIPDLNADQQCCQPKNVDIFITLYFVLHVCSMLVVIYRNVDQYKMPTSVNYGQIDIKFVFAGRYVLGNMNAVSCSLLLISCATFQVEIYATCVCNIRKLVQNFVKTVWNVGRSSMFLSENVTSQFTGACFLQYSPAPTKCGIEEFWRNLAFN